MFAFLAYFATGIRTGSFLIFLTTRMILPEVSPYVFEFVCAMLSNAVEVQSYGYDLSALLTIRKVF